jgi:CBS domain-containing protein
MTAAELLSHHIPSLQLTDIVQFAKDIMIEHHVTELPVTEHQKYIGMVFEDEIEDADDLSTIEKYIQTNNLPKVHPADFFLVPLKIMQQQKLRLLPVVKEDNELLGVITDDELLHAASFYNAANIPGGIIILQMLPNNFYISEIGRIIESNNAKIIHLNTWNDPATGELRVSIKVNKNDIQDILSSFERYNYNIIQYFGENLSETELKQNFDHLMNYLNI